MRVQKLPARRLLVLTAAVATVAAGIPALLSAPASAAATGDIALSGPSQGAAGACLSYTVTPTDAFGRVANDTGTVVIRLTENPNDSSQDVDFCRVGTMSTPTVLPHYTNANNARQTYTAGPTITSTATTGTGATTPDVASTSTPATQSNPSGKDTAVYVYDGRQGASTTITFGVVGLVPGKATLDVFRSADGDEVQSPGDYSRSLSVTFTAGGLPGSPEAADAVATVAVTPKQSFSPTGGAAHSFTVKLTNSSGDGVAGVTPAIAATAGPNAPTTAVPAGTFTASCTASNNSGVATCSYAGSKSGTDTVTIWVDQTRARTPNPTGGLDVNEPRDTATATNTVSTAQAKVIDLAPATSTVVSGSSKQLTATVADANGTPAAGVQITFTESGPGSIQGGTAGATTGTSTLNATTDSAGQATVTIVTAAADSGASTVTAAIRFPTNTSCQSSGGTCTDTSTITVGAASPSPSPSSTVSPSPGLPPRRAVLTLTVNTPLIPAGSTATLTARGSANQQYQLQCYTRPSTTYFTARSGAFDSVGSAVTFTLALGRNTRCFIQYAVNAAQGASGSVVVNVRTVLSLSTVRTGTRTYIFQGRNLPRVAGQLITLYRVDGAGNEIRTSNLITDASGIYRVTRTFTGVGTFPFRVRTSQTLNNAAGVSNTISVRVY